MKTLFHLLVTVVAGTALLAPADPATAATPGMQPAAFQRHVTLEVRTVPALPSLRLRFDGVELRTDQNGRALIRRPHDFAGHSLGLVDNEVTLGDRRYTFARWAGQRDPDQAFRPDVTGLPMRASYTVTVAFTVRFPVTPSYVDQHGVRIDPARISRVTMKSDTGRMVDLPRAGTTWLDGLLPTYHKSVLANRPVSYSLYALVVNGTNVVDAGRQRFRPMRERAPVFKGAFYDLTVRAADAVFGDPLGTAAVVTYPDGSVHSRPFSSDHSVTLTDLPRGHYKVAIKAGNGVVMPEELRLSKTRAVQVRVVSRASVVLLCGLGVLLAAGLILIGRPRWNRLLLRGARALLAIFPRLWRSRRRRSSRMEVPTG